MARQNDNLSHPGRVGPAAQRGTLQGQAWGRGSPTSARCAPHSRGSTRVTRAPFPTALHAPQGPGFSRALNPLPLRELGELGAAVRLLAGGGSRCTPSVSLLSRWWVKDEVAPGPGSCSSCSTSAWTPTGPPCTATDGKDCAETGSSNLSAHHLQANIFM